jgi:hypothetical protein
MFTRMSHERRLAIYVNDLYFDIERFSPGLIRKRADSPPAAVPPKR